MDVSKETRSIPFLSQQGRESLHSQISKSSQSSLKKLASGTGAIQFGSLAPARVGECPIPEVHGAVSIGGEPKVNPK